MHLFLFFSLYMLCTFCSENSDIFIKYACFIPLSLHTIFHQQNHSFDDEFTCGKFASKIISFALLSSHPILRECISCASSFKFICSMNYTNMIFIILFFFLRKRRRRFCSLPQNTVASFGRC